MHKTFLLAVALLFIVVAAVVHSPLTLMSCGIVVGVATVGYLVMNAAFGRRLHRQPPEYTVLIRQFAVGMLAATLVSYAMVAPLALQTFTGSTLFIAFALMSFTTGFVCAWLACTLRVEQVALRKLRA
jgi:RsiW-degrading membrane proteinase PrsW (M82 family)